MSQSPPPHHSQQTKARNSSVKGQVGQARRDLWQFQFLFGGKRAKAQQERQNRKALIDKVRNFWIKGVLEKSLHRQAMIELRLEKRLNVIEQPFNMDWVTPERLQRSLPSDTKVIDLLNQLGEGGTLLILGEPGSGKTFALLGLAHNLLEQVEQDETKPIPVVFNLSSWKGGKQTIAKWITQELQEKYQVSKTLSDIWVKNEQLVLLLDGLDEVPADLRDACITALNQFIQVYGRTKTVVCSRVKDYEALFQHLKFQDAILLKPLTIEQVNQYLSKAGEELTGVRTAIKLDPLLQELVDTPLMLSVVTLTYQGVPVQDFPKANSKSNYLQSLFNAYIERMFFRRQANKKIYTKEKSKYWLKLLAKQISEEAQSIFLIERMQPIWLQTRSQKQMYRAGMSLFLGLSFWLTGVAITLAVNEIDENIIFGLILALGFGLFGALGGRHSDSAEIKPVESLRWSWVNARTALSDWLIGEGSEIIKDVRKIMILVVVVTAIWSLISWLRSGSEPSTVIFGLIGIIIFGIQKGLSGPDIEIRTVPNQGIWNSIANTVIFGLIGGLAFGLIGSSLFGLPNGLFLVLVGLLDARSAAMPCIQHFVLRLTLYREGYIPWNYARFLDYATERIFLHKVGGGYIFIHRMLLEHFAQMEVD